MNKYYVLYTIYTVLFKHFLDQVQNYQSILPYHRLNKDYQSPSLLYILGLGLSHPV